MKSEKNSYKRAKRFEIFLARLLEAESLKVTYDPKTARPRQTDLVASSDGDYFIIEAKCTKKTTGIGDIAQVRDRLKRVPQHMFACVFSTGGFSSKAIEEVQHDKSREIYLFNEIELRGITTGGISFHELLVQKKEYLRVHGAVFLLDDVPSPTPIHNLRDEPDVFEVGGRLLPWLRNRTGYNDIIFATEFLDTSAKRAESVFSLELQPHVDSLHDLSRTLKIIQNLFGLSGQGSFSIHQSGEGWFGFGLESFLAAASQQKVRYDELNWKSYHHSEELGYFDRLENGGMICVTSRQSTGTNFLHSTFLEIYFPGIPVDTSAVRRLCKLMKHEEAHLEVVGHDPIYSSAKRLGIQVKPVGAIISKIRGEPCTSGLIVENPFLLSEIPSVGDEELERTINLIRNYQFLICSLRDWHDAGNLMKSYRLSSVEACWIEHFCTVRIVCDWD